MTISNYLKRAKAKLDRAHIPSSRLDSLLLISDEISKDKSWILAHGDTILSTTQLVSIDKKIERRAGHEPLAYIRGKTEFYGREFLVTPDTLQPRPETETMIELLLKMKNDARQITNIVDVGTGSGCIAITAKLELPDAEVYATDISENCLEVAAKNAKTLKANVQFCKVNLLKALPSTIYQQPIAILANLPYVPDSHTINQAAMHEPKLAIFGGEDGLDYYRQIFEQINVYSIIAPHILTESLPPQHSSLEKIARNNGYSLHGSQDFIQVFVKQ